MSFVMVPNLYVGFERNEKCKIRFTGFYDGEGSIARGKHRLVRENLF